MSAGREYAAPLSKVQDVIYKPIVHGRKMAAVSRPPAGGAYNTQQSQQVNGEQLHNLLNLTT